ncbi:exodeoxyribonuclease III [Coprothermobacteraceae bacterium]|nr:exodeoxyribonuclease III [Coprothermobacteraceae bacterium]
MKLATFNVNGIRSRIEEVNRLLNQVQPDVVGLQEIKCETSLFPYESFAGYYCSVSGQKGYNGVAICSRVQGSPLEILNEVESRSIGYVIGGLLIVNVYAPHGDARGTPKFVQKLNWFGKLRQRLQELLTTYSSIVIMGDFNVALEDIDVWDPLLLKDTVGTYAEEREEMLKLMEIGFVDVFRYLNPNASEYTWWDYTSGRAKRNQGLRIDYILVSENLLPSVRECHILRDLRVEKSFKPSDHVPVVCTLDLLPT